MSNFTVEQRIELLKIAVDVAHRSEVSARWRIGSLYVFFLDLIERTPGENIDFKEAFYSARDMFDLPEVQKALEFAIAHPEFIYGSEPSAYIEARDNLVEILGIERRAENQRLFKYFSEKYSSSNEERQ